MADKQPAKADIEKKEAPKAKANKPEADKGEGEGEKQEAAMIETQERLRSTFGLPERMTVEDYMAALDAIPERAAAQLPVITGKVEGAVIAYRNEMVRSRVDKENGPLVAERFKQLEAEVEAALEYARNDKETQELIAKEPLFKNLSLDKADASKLTAMFAAEAEEQADRMKRDELERDKEAAAHKQGRKGDKAEISKGEDADVAQALATPKLPAVKGKFAKPEGKPLAV